MQWHPDRHQGDKKAEAKFMEINEAYKTLSDTQKRKQYDAFGNTDFGNMGG
jgi:DnaJ-class molecular chaperone